MRHIFIVNPTAGKGRGKQMINIINSRLGALDQSFEIKVTEAPGHAQELSREAAGRHEDLRLYSVGGDGTLNEIVNGMAGSQAELGIIPCGSGNDTARSLYKITDPVKLIEILPASPCQTIDLGRINDKYFINIASIGFDAAVTLKSRAFKRYPLVSGSMAYVLGVAMALIQLKKYKMRIKVGGCSDFEQEKHLLMAVFANGSFYGGGMKPAPEARMDDGLLDFCLVEPVTRLKITRFFPAFQKGLHESMKEVSMLRGTKAVFESDSPFPVNIDGEVGVNTKVSLEIVPACLKIIVPV